jgi:hypothetical protein
MKKYLMALAFSLPLMAQAQEHYDLGSYWQISGVKTMPTKFDAYIEDIGGLWRSEMERLKDDGKVLSYKLLSNVHARDGEPTLWLMVEWKSAADMLDTPFEYWETMVKEVVGSMEKSEELAVERGELRTIMGDTLAREIMFK